MKEGFYELAPKYVKKIYPVQMYISHELLH